MVISCVGMPGWRPGAVSTCSHSGGVEIIITKHKGLSVMGGAGREILTLADGAASWTIKDMRTQRGRHSHELSL